jgi:hypothetical protein
MIDEPMTEIMDKRKYPFQLLSVLPLVVCCDHICLNPTILDTINILKAVVLQYSTKPVRAFLIDSPCLVW